MIETSVRISSDQSTSSLSLVDLTGLSFSVSAQSLYVFEFYMMFSIAVGSTFPVWGMAVPAFSVFSAKVTTRVSVADQAFGGLGFGWLTSSGDSTSGGATSLTLARIYLATIKGEIFPTANGTAQVQFASTSGSDITVKANTCGLLQRGY